MSLQWTHLPWNKIMWLKKKKNISWLFSVLFFRLYLKSLDTEMWSDLKALFCSISRFLYLFVHPMFIVCIHLYVFVHCDIFCTSVHIAKHCGWPSLNFYFWTRQWVAALTNMPPCVRSKQAWSCAVASSGHILTVLLVAHDLSLLVWETLRGEQSVQERGLMKLCTSPWCWWTPGPECLSLWRFEKMYAALPLGWPV